jgi:hypothetical protein
MRTDRQWVTNLIYRKNCQGELVPERKVKVPYGNKGIVDATEIPVDESNEKWSDVKLSDGAHLRFKSSVVNALRVDGEYDNIGNPIYLLQMSPTMIAVEIPEKLKRKKSS